MPRKLLENEKIYKGVDGNYHCHPSILQPDGTVTRPHVKRKQAAQVKARVDELRKRSKRGRGVVAKVETLEDWLTHYVHVILVARRDAGGMTRNTWDDYESLFRVHIIPNLGQWRISGMKRRLEPEYVEVLWAKLISQGSLAPSYVGRMHIYLKQALTVAFKRDQADRNVMDHVTPPAGRSKGKKIQSPPYAEACKLVGEALQDELAFRWLLGMLSGPRQAEVLGIRWTHIHLDPEPPQVPHILMSKQIQRHKWSHGCGDPVVCNKTRTKKDSNDVEQLYDPCNRKMCGKHYGHGCGNGDDEKPLCGKKIARYCPAKNDLGGCFRHRTKDGQQKPCPAPCAADCREHASTCPSRKDGGLVETGLKTHASEGPLVLGTILVDLIRAERERQIREGKFDANGYLVQGSKPGKPLDPRRDYDKWCAIEKRAGVTHGRLHAGTRHLTGSMLSATGADVPMIRDILRQADTSVAAGYVTTGLDARRDALERVSEALINGDISKILGAKRVAQHAS